MTREARPRSGRVTPESLRPTSSEITFPPVRMAMSCSISLRRSPNPGALTAAELKNDREYLRRVIDLLKPKVKLILDFVGFGTYFFRDPEQYDKAARLKHWKEPQTAARLEKLAARLAELKEFSQQATEEAVRRLAEELNVTAAKLIHPTRLALTGFGVGAGLFETMALLGKDRVIARLQKAVKILKAD